jgi:tetratricopeptide (TPR) repeat protein
MSKNHKRGRSRFSDLLLFPVYGTAVVAQRLFGDRRERKNEAWSERLHYTDFLRGLPALLVCIAAPALLATAWATRRSVERTYIETARAAQEQGNADVAALAARRLLSLRPDEKNYVFQLALAYEQQGNLNQAEGLMRSLAPPDEVVYAPAQLWWARQRLREPLTSDRLRDVEARLIRVREGSQFADQAAEVLAELYLRTGRAEWVARDAAMTRAAEQSPSLRLLVLQSRGNRLPPDRLVAEGRALSEEFRRRLSKNPDDVVARRELVQAQILMGDLSAADATLGEGLTLRDDPTLGEMLIAVRLEALRRLPQAKGSGAVRTKFARDALKLFDKYPPRNDERRLDRARLYRAANQAEPALTDYRAVIDRLPLARLEYAELLLQLDRKAEADAEFRNTMTWYAKLDDAQRAVSTAVRLSGPLAAIRLGEFAQAVQWLTAGGPTETKPDAAARTGMLLAAYLGWNDALQVKAEPDSVAQRVRLLRDALEIAPSETAVWQRVLQLAADPGDANRAVRQMLNDRIASGRAPATTYLLAGIEAVLRGDHAAAVPLFEQAQRLDPKLYQALNNLAWSLAFGPQPDYPRALAVIDSALAKAPNDLRMRDTRGRILAKLERWKDALIDLEACATLLRDDAEYHRVLAEVYDHLQLPDVAKRHRDKAIELSK